MIANACDHAGIDLKPHVIAVLDELGIPYKDLGTNSHESVDYPIYGARAANAVASGECSMGIIMCGTGVGIGMAAATTPPLPPAWSPPPARIPIPPR